MADRVVEEMQTGPAYRRPNDHETTIYTINWDRPSPITYDVSRRVANCCAVAGMIGWESPARRSRRYQRAGRGWQ
jgi:hypothetical protein